MQRTEIKMKRKAHEPHKPTDPAGGINPRVLTIPMVARFLSSTNWFVEELIRNKEIFARMQGKSWVVDLHDVNAWIDEQNKAGRRKEILYHIPQIMTDAEAQQFFAGTKQDENGNLIAIDPDDGPDR
jgi:hypothetical protein